MTVTDPTRAPETFFCDWRTQQRGARIIERPKDIMFDIDDVLFPTMHEIHRLALEAGLHDGTVKPAWTGWKVYTLPDGSPCTEEIYWDLWSQFALDGGYVSTPPIAEAAEALRRLYFAGHRIHLVTARGFMAHADDIRRWTPQWIEEYALPWHTLTFAKDKVAAQERILAPFKAPCEGRYFSYAIDDSPKNFEALFDAGVEAYLLDHDHNEDYVFADPECDVRVATVTEFADIIEESTK